MLSPLVDARVPVLDDETPPESVGDQLALALECHDAWHERDELARSGALTGAFLRHIGANVPAFAERSDRRDLSAFPVLERETMRANRRAFLSGALLAEGEQLHTWTNRSSGVPLKVAFDRASLFDADHATYARVADRFPGLRGRFAPGEANAFLVTDTPGHACTSIVLPALGATILRRVVLGAGDDPQRLEYLRAAPVRLLYGKPTVLLDLAELDESVGGGAIAAEAILVSGARLYPDHRARLERWYGAKVIDAYMATEGGLIALECPWRTGLHVRTDRVRLEVMGDDGTIADVGEGDLLLTNLFNWAQAFVRYRIGDRGTLAHVACGCGHRGPTLTSLAGRDATSIDLGGVRIPTVLLDEVLVAADIARFQVVASDGGLVVRWQPAMGTDPSERSDAIVAALEARLPGVEITTEAYERLVPPTGKLVRYPTPWKSRS